MRTGDDPLKSLGISTPSRVRRYAVRAVVVLAVIAVLVGVVALVRSRQPKPRSYVTETVRREDLVITVTATGTLKPRNAVEVGAEVSGRVARVLVEPNARVTQGQLLAEIDPEQLSATLDETRAALASSDAAVRLARASAVEARQVHDRVTSLRGRDLASAAELEAAVAAAERADAEVANAVARLAVSRAAVTKSRSALGKTRIVSPIDGIVLTRSVEPGQTVAAAFQSPILFTLAQDLSRMTLHVNVDEADVGHVHEGQNATFTVDAYPARSFRAQIVSVRYAPQTVANVVTYEALLEVDNAEGLLRPGMTATANIVTDADRGVLTVSNAALRFVPPEGAGATGPFGREAPDTDPGAQYVWIPGTPAPSRVNVQTGRTNAQRSEVHGPNVREGMTVIVDIQPEGTRP